MKYYLGITRVASKIWSNNEIWHRSWDIKIFSTLLETKLFFSSIKQKRLLVVFEVSKHKYKNNIYKQFNH